MSTIKFSSTETEQLVIKIQDYFAKELDQDLGQFDAEFLLDFFSKEVGAHFYNRGLSDAQLVIAAKLDNVSEMIQEGISEIEKPIS
ncbi:MULTISPECIES: DUF2164 domain-containing protein [Colwellia]|uniref:DUF2164 domain-containing protein n=1 Tax=Colwellia psychrerythraea (strain 34H / ATCC BAA-681) TaxID=167879 RepID=Q47WA6_COLP3|nr:MULTISPECIES: DUF2164 domain-containing protein [Colwellia]AAZ24131.1 hypothetical protein CPS_4266 [Colwellia psychrerythraea 34H]PKH85390.1 DUF2164 domain-containing protein [Colwellia sp. Bg11-28]